MMVHPCGSCADGVGTVPVDLREGDRVWLCEVCADYRQRTGSTGPRDVVRSATFGAGGRVEPKDHAE